MFLSSKNRKNPLDVSELKHQKTFISFKKKCNNGEFQESKVVYKIIKKKNIIYNYIYIGNAYDLDFVTTNSNNEIIKNTKLMLLQDNNDKLYITPVDEGRVIYASKTWSWFEFRTYLSYVPILNKQFNFDDENEHLFSIDTNLKEFTAIGPNIDGKILNGYEITYIRSLKENEKKKEENNITISKKDIDDINEELNKFNNEQNNKQLNESQFDDINLDDLI